MAMEPLQAAEPQGVQTTVQVHFMAIMTPPGTPRGEGDDAEADEEVARRPHRKARISLSDWFGYGDEGSCSESEQESDEEPRCTTFLSGACSESEQESDEDVRSTTASETGEAGRSPPRSPTRRLSRRIRDEKSPSKKKSTVRMLPQIYYLGDDEDDTRLEFALSPRKGGRMPLELEELELQLPNDESACSSEVGQPRRRRHSAMGRLQAAVESCIEEIYAEQYAETGYVEYSEASEVSTHYPAEYDQPKYVVSYRALLNMSLELKPSESKEKWPQFEKGLKGHLKKLILSASNEDDRKGDNINLLVLMKRDKKTDKVRKAIVPTPEEFGRVAQNLVTKRPGEAGKDQQAILDLSRKYTKMFNKVNGVDEDHDSLDVVMELLDDVRTSAWNMAAFMFRR